MKFYVVGLGSIGLRHAQNLMALGHEVFGYDPDVEKKTKAESLGVNSSFLIDSIDALVVASPTDTHLYWLRKALEWSMPCFVEKPLFHDNQLAEFDKLLPALEFGVPRPLVAVGNNLRFHPSVRQLKTDIVEQKMGRPVWALIPCAQYNDKSQYLRDGVTLNWGAHEIDLALHLFGPARVEGASIDKDDTIAQILLVHGEWYGTRSIIHLDYVTNPEVRSPMIFGTKGEVAIDLPGRTMMWKYNSKQGQSVGGGGYDTDYIDEMQAFADAVEGKKPWPGATAREALEVIKIIYAAKIAAKMIEEIGEDD